MMMPSRRSRLEKRMAEEIASLLFVALLVIPMIIGGAPFWACWAVAWLGYWLAGVSLKLER